jgi:hypothetical protein
MTPAESNVYSTKFATLVTTPAGSNHCKTWNEFHFIKKPISELIGLPMKVIVEQTSKVFKTLEVSCYLGDNYFFFLITR